ncbi:MAG: peroxiredoxin, partial [Catenulispora sp.]|nr:peroxiredoxin [Catenulispora sp.]
RVSADGTAADRVLTAGTATDPVSADSMAADPVSADTAWTVLYTFPGSPSVEPGLAPGWEHVPGGPGCTLEARTFRDRLAEFTQADAAVIGVCTQRPEQLAQFAAAENLPFPLLSDQDLEFTTALRMPSFRAANADRLKRATLIVDATRTVRGVLYPVPDPAASVDDALRIIEGLRGRQPVGTAKGPGTP